MNILPIKRSDNEISTWRPFEEMSTIHERINQLFNRISGDDLMLSEQAWSPMMDVIENEKEITLQLDVPGMEKKDIAVEVEDNSITVKGERKREAKEKTDSHLHIERGYGSFMRRFPVPDYVDKEHMTAKCKNGLLSISMSKIPGKKSKAKVLKIEG
jgi:HSP20 family protein